MKTHSYFAHIREWRALFFIIAAYAIFGGLSLSFFHDTVAQAFSRASLAAGWVYVVDAIYFLLTVTLVFLLVIYTMGIIRHYEGALSASEERFRCLINSMDDAVFTLDRELRHTGVYGRWLHEVGIETTSLLGKTIRDIFPTPLAARHEDASRRALHGEHVVYEWGGDDWYGEYFSTTVSPLRDANGDTIGLVVISRKISDQKRAEIALEHAAAEWRTTFDAMRDSVALLAEDGTVLRANKATTAMVGCSSFDALLGHPCHQVLHGLASCPGDCPFTRLRVTLRRETSSFQRHDRWYSVTVDPLLDDHGQLRGAIHTMADITARKQVEAALQESEARFRTIFEHAAIGVTLLDIDGHILDINSAFQKMLGYSRDALCKKTYTDISHADDIDTEMQLFAKLVIGETDLYHIEKRYRHADGTMVWGNVTASLVRNEHGTPNFIIGTIEDITERKQAEDRIREYQRQLVSLASELSLAEERERRRIATGLHDHISQALAISNIKLGALREDVTAFPAQVASIDEIRDLLFHAYEDCQSLTFELSPPMLYDLGLQAAIEWLAEQMQDRYDMTITVTGEDGTAPLTDEMRALLYRAVRELLINVVKHARAGHVRIALRRVIGFLEIVVEDDGIGFDPLRHAQSGSGLGGFGLFSICERLKHFAGRAEIVSAPGDGTRVTLVLPCHTPGDVIAKGTASCIPGSC